MLLPLLVLAVPILDTTLVTVMRLAREAAGDAGRARTTRRTGSSTTGSRSRRRSALLLSIAIALGATSIAYNVLDNERLTIVGVLAHLCPARPVRRLPVRSERTHAPRPGRRHVAAARADVRATPARRGARRLRAHLRLVPRRIPARRRQQGNGAAARCVPGPPCPSCSASVTSHSSRFGIYRRVWRYATSRDALAIAAAVGISELVAVGIVVATRSLGPFPARVFLVDAVLCTALVTASRLDAQAAPAGARGRLARDRERVLVVGAGRHGRSVARELRESGTRVVGFVDDNASLRRRRIAGVTVLGAIDEIATLARLLATGRGARVDPRRVARASRTGRRGVQERGRTVPLRASAHRDTGRAGRGDSRVTSATAASRREADADATGRASPAGRTRAAACGVFRPVRSLRLAGVATRGADDLHRRARDDADLPLHRRHGATRSSRRVVRLHDARPWLTAPAWWISDVETAFAAIKYAQTLVMAAAIFPAYLLARTVVSSQWALFAAIAAIAAPALSYAPMLVEEPFAYPAATLALWLLVANGRASDLALVPARRGRVRPRDADPLAADRSLPRPRRAVCWCSAGGASRCARYRSTWSRWDWVGALALARRGGVVRDGLDRKPLGGLGRDDGALERPDRRVRRSGPPAGSRSASASCR